MKALHQHYVESAERDADGYWIHLRRGFQCHGDHSIVENTKRAAERKLEDVKPCLCAECVKVKAA